MAQATDTSLGEIILAGDLAGDGGAQVGTNPQLTSLPGLVPGQYDVADITVDSKGRITAIASASISSVSNLVPSATTSSKGIVQVGDNLHIQGTGTSGFWTVDLAIGAGGDATGLANDSCAQYALEISVDEASAQPIVIFGNAAQTFDELITQINADLMGATASISSGDIIIVSDVVGKASSVLLANDALFTCLTTYIGIGSATVGLGSCTIYAKDASPVVAGVVQIGNGIDVDVATGVISVDLSTTPIATTNSLGAVMVPNSGNINIDGSGNISVPIATSSDSGLVSIPGGDGLVVSAGVLSINTSLMARADAVGGFGVVSIGSNIDVSSGVISVSLASVGTLGLVRVGNGVLVDGNGVISVAPATYADTTTTTKGIMQIGSHLLDELNGKVGAEKASGDTIYGVVRSADTAKITINAGEIDINPSGVLLTSTHNTFTKAQVVALSPLMVGASAIQLDATQSNTFELTLTTTATLNNPSGLVSGQTLVIIIKQDGTGNRLLSFGSLFKFTKGVTPTISTTPNAIDVLSCICDGSHLYCSINKGFN